MHKSVKPMHGHAWCCNFSNRIMHATGSQTEKQTDPYLYVRKTKWLLDRQEVDLERWVRAGSRCVRVSGK